jgi:hypothetical protein
MSSATSWAGIKIQHEPLLLRSEAVPVFAVPIIMPRFPFQANEFRYWEE